MASIRLLLVDDEPELVFTMQERLELRGYTVDAVTSGEEALERIEDDSKEYDVVVVDVKMPGVGGDEVLAAVRDTNPHLPVILLTGHGGGVNGGEEGLLRASCAFLYKPVKIEELIETIKSCIRPAAGSDDD